MVWFLALGFVLVVALVGKASASAHSLRASIAANVLQETDAHYGVEASLEEAQEQWMSQNPRTNVQSSPFYQQIQWEVDNPSANIQSSPYYAQSRGALQAAQQQQEPGGGW